MSRVRFPLLPDFLRNSESGTVSLSLVSTTEELPGRKSSGSGLQIREYGRRDPSRWSRCTLFTQTLALTSPTKAGRSVFIVRSRTQITEFSLAAELLETISLEQLHKQVWLRLTDVMCPYYVNRNVRPTCDFRNEWIVVPVGHQMVLTTLVIQNTSDISHPSDMLQPNLWEQVGSSRNGNLDREAARFEPRPGGRCFLQFRHASAWIVPKLRPRPLLITFFSVRYSIINLLFMVGWGAMLQAWRSLVPISMRSVDFLSITLILPAALSPWGILSL
jgi:hypothetical protein